mmetsp:Transcript_37252/g.110831  ORF Transcript_37252/g.110831 Transcript_37252/m.110831 type:complete len:216 (-) Transcript_37252:597-1244(-)
MHAQCRFATWRFSLHRPGGSPHERAREVITVALTCERATSTAVSSGVAPRCARCVRLRVRSASKTASIPPSSATCSTASVSSWTANCSDGQRSTAVRSAGTLQYRFFHRRPNVVEVQRNNRNAQPSCRAARQFATKLADQKPTCRPLAASSKNGGRLSVIITRQRGAASADLATLPVVRLAADPIRPSGLPEARPSTPGCSLLGARTECHLPPRG